MRIDEGEKDETRSDEGEGDGGGIGAESCELVEKWDEEEDDAEENDEASESARCRECALRDCGGSAQTSVSPQ